MPGAAICKLCNGTERITVHYRWSRRDGFVADYHVIRCVCVSPW